MFYFRHGNYRCRYSDSKTKNGEINPEPCKAHWKRDGSGFKFNYHNPRGEVDHATAWHEKDQQLIIEFIREDDFFDARVNRGQTGRLIYNM